MNKLFSDVAKTLGIIGLVGAVEVFSGSQIGNDYIRKGYEKPMIDKIWSEAPVLFKISQYPVHLGINLAYALGKK